MSNEVGVTMNGYVAFYKNRRIEVRASTSLEAQNTAAAIFGARKSYEVTVVLAEIMGEPVTHVAVN